MCSVMKSVLGGVLLGDRLHIGFPGKRPGINLMMLI